MDRPNEPMSEMAFNLKITKYVIVSLMTLFAMSLGTCAYVNAHTDNAKTRQDELQFQAAHEAAVKAMFEHK